MLSAVVSWFIVACIPRRFHLFFCLRFTICFSISFFVSVYEVLFHSRADSGVVGACPVTTDPILAMSYVRSTTTITATTNMCTN